MSDHAVLQSATHRQVSTTLHDGTRLVPVNHAIRFLHTAGVAAAVCLKRYVTLCNKLDCCCAILYLSTCVSSGAKLQLASAHNKHDSCAVQRSVRRSI